MNKKKEEIITLLTLVRNLEISPVEKTRIVQNILSLAGEPNGLKISHKLANQFVYSEVLNFFDNKTVEEVKCYDFIKHRGNPLYHLGVDSDVVVWKIVSPKKGERFKDQVCYEADEEESALYFMCLAGTYSKQMARKVAKKFNLQLVPMFDDDDVEGHRKWTVE